MTVTIPINKIELHPGSLITLNDLTWEQFEAFLEEKEANGIKTRVAYSQETLTIMSPLPAHERPHRIISDIVKVLLDSQERDWEEFGSTTFRKKAKKVGLEPDTCFYIQNAQKMRSRMRIDLTVDPPPDLAIEVDVTSKTTLDAYEALAVPELWIYTEEKFTIQVFTDGLYVESSISPTFPNLPILELIPNLVNQVLTMGSSKMLRELRKKMS
ncbi:MULTISPECIES: Uma2 family endonuclease [unclassified Okeania]|uniref:Uma2 family endonuclease n=1 Tax=unclassified Okeania TaxID=2634635 RepID=UPI0013BE1225|nr:MULTISPECIES: Uma2 family endonuclease [unclassified Okeania]NEQ75040.1 Uma2 family endonuclease [Okeania sp. SIO2C9]NES64824.1 Uma2 family endonuclease [Okeania sp. SIO2D1]NET42844.1 Uma2 family endonuclease [Okeania sp. SIO2B3]